MHIQITDKTAGKLIYVICVLLLYACGSGAGDGDNASKDKGKDFASEDFSEKHREKDDDEHDDNKRNVGTTNVIAVHNPGSPQFNENCLDCHSDIPNKQSLDNTIPTAHNAMLSFTPGEDNAQCAWCHRNVSATLIHAAAAPGPFATNIRKLVDTQMCAICHGPVGPGKQFYRSGLTTSDNPDGIQLYHHLCAACHGELANSDIKGESAEEVYEAITENEGGMAPLNVLNPLWIKAITVSLGGDPTLPSGIPPIGTGASLYLQYCSNCHGTLLNSTKLGASANQIQAAVDTNTGGMAALNFLTATQIQDIADALSGGGSGGGGGGTGGGGGITDGISLYQDNCASCHGPLSNSSQSRASSNTIQNAINNDVGGMNVLSSLTSIEIQAIADALIGSGSGGGADPGSTDGVALYQSYCSNCHRSVDASQVSGESSAQIRKAISDDEGGMASLAFLSLKQIDAIAAVLVNGDIEDDDD